ncbi:MAG TPA: hypothetical protein VKU79_02295 [Thermoplasmataceae archaeon]|nr:hypothetical protein [Thermoplasmataceae archaeon]
MPKEEKKVKSTISGKSFEEVRRMLLRRTLGLKDRISTRYDELYRMSTLDHVKMLLHDLKSQEEEDKKMIKKVLETGDSSRIMPKDSEIKSLEMMDHIIAQDMDDPKPNDLRSVLLSAIKSTDDLHKVLSLMSSEYEGTEIKMTLKALADHEMEKKTKLEEIYDDLINQEYW